MNISQSYGMSGMSSMQSMTGMQGKMPPPPPPEDGKLSGYMAENRGSEETKSFMNSFKEMSKSGEFDAAALAEQAPESLKAYAEEQGVDLESMLEGAYEKFEERASKGGRKGPPPSEGGNMQGAMSAYSSIAQGTSSESNLLNSLMSAISIKETV